MVNRLLDIANIVGNEIQTIVPIDLGDSSFNCPVYIKKISHEKHIHIATLENLLFIQI